MAVTLVGTSSGAQGLFNRLGKIGNSINECLAAAGTDLPADVLEAIVLFDGATDQQRAPVPGLLGAIDSLRTSFAPVLEVLRAQAVTTLVGMFDIDSPLPALDAPTALELLRQQMSHATTTHVDANSIGGSVTQTNLVGTGVVVVSVKDGYGRNLENLLAETVRITCTDSAADDEALLFRGESSADSKLAYNWPAGSGAGITVSSVGGTSSRNLVANGTFEAFATANTPDDWDLDVATPGTDILNEASIVYKGAHALKIVGDSSTLTAISQQIASLSARQPYAVNLWTKCSGTPADGEATISLVDETGTVIADDAGTNNSFTIDLTALGTTYVAKNGVFRLPDPLPAEVHLKIELTTALSTGTSWYIDDVVMQPMTKLVAQNLGGTAWVCAFSGDVPFDLDDGIDASTFKAVFTNDRASEWQTLFDRLFGTSDSGFILPTSGTTLINDSLIG